MAKLLWSLADNGWADHTCSECGWTKNTDIHVRLGYDVCPNCGTKWDNVVSGSLCGNCDCETAGLNTPVRLGSATLN